MVRMSLRGWLLLVSVLFAVLVVGGIALTSYVIVSDGMRAVALDTTRRLARASATIVTELTADSEAHAALNAEPGQNRNELALSVMLERMPASFNRFDRANIMQALYDQEMNLLWARTDQSVIPGREAARQEAIKRGTPTESVQRSHNLLAGLVRNADLGLTVSHVPVRLPGGSVGVLDVAYIPNAEEGVIDTIRAPMATLAVSAMLIMIVLVQTSMAWVLRLVDNLRKAADSIDAGRLDARLPESEGNEVGALARSLNRLIDRLDRRATAQSQFVADASHELATPVAGIRGYTSILKAWGTDDPEIQAEAIDAIDRESRRMARLTSDLLNLLHADQGLRLSSEKFDLNMIARERVAATATRYMDKDIEFIGPDDSVINMVGDPDRIDDVLSILLDNAGKYTPRGGTVSLATHKGRAEVTIEVSDSGVGIPQVDLPRVFDRFYRSEAARAAGEGGFGLGLAIARSIVESMQGSISVVSTEGAGTTFTITLPKGRH